MKRGLVRTAVLVLAAVLAFLVMVDPGLLAPPIDLLIGWWPAGARLVGAWHPAKNSVILFALAVLTFVAGCHIFLRWLHQALQAGQGASGQGRWRWKWTLCGCGIGLFTLVAISCLVLTTHQLYWFSKSNDPWFTDPRRESLAARVVAQALESSAEQAQWQAPQTRAAFCQIVSPATGRPALESLQPIWITRDEQLLRAVVLVPRRPMYRARASLVVIQPGTPALARKLEELPRVLASFGIGGTAGGPRGATELLP